MQPKFASIGQTFQYSQMYLINIK